MKIVIVESPFAADTVRDRRINLEYARAAMRDCLLRGEAPYASHLLYTQPGVFNDNIPEERHLGIQAGFEFRRLADHTYFYVDRGISKGMQLGIDDCEAKGRSYSMLSLSDWC